ncbi:MAG: carbohydrate-binding family 9-like protein [Pirellulaceae bacterium]|nr:carbohydrate-binding family 9-like protein [Pirellulaceae bacterium]
MPEQHQRNAVPSIKVASCSDFEVTGIGDHPAWDQVDWVPMQLRADSSADYNSRFKILYSTSGIYVLFDGSDRILSATLQEDFSDLWTEDVFECFFWTDQRYPIYFEYEISPLGFELPILVPNFDGQFLGWRPWHYEANRRTRKAIAIHGGEMESGAAITGWSAEVFLPFALLSPLRQVPPQPGTRWQANFYRMDYDHGRPSSWHWSPVGPSFHETQNFGALIFE